MSSPGGYLDSHLHLQAHSLEFTTGGILERAERAGVERMFCNATHEGDWQAVISLAGSSKERRGGPTILPFLGIHPWFAESAGPGWEERLLKQLQGVPAGMGEIGLDKSCGADFDRQRLVFETQLQMAAKLRRPVAIHCVKAWGLLLEILEQFAQEKKLPAIMIHAYGGSTETLRRLIELDCFISFSCRLITDRKRHPSFLATPLPRLLLETDSQGRPSVASARDGAGATDSQGRSSVASARDEEKGASEGPRHARKEQPVAAEHPGISCNEPADIPGLYGWAAAMRGMGEDELRQRIWSNGEIFTDTILPR
jgi:TatD DNase family protein